MIVGISGFKRSGKDTFTKFVIEEIKEKNGKYPEPEIIYFADKLKKSAAVLFQEHGDHIEWSNKFKETGRVVVRTDEDSPEYIITGREILQRYGTEAHRDIFGEDFWIEQALPINLDDSKRIILVPDLRFPNEAQRIRTLGGIVVRINRDMFGEEDTHASEKPLSDKLVDVEIDNNDTIDVLKGEAINFCYYHLFPKL